VLRCAYTDATPLAFSEGRYGAIHIDDAEVEGPPISITYRKNKMINKAAFPARDGTRRDRAHYATYSCAKPLLLGCGVLAASIPLLYPAESLAQQTQFPTRPLRIIVGFTPASSTDIWRNVSTSLWWSTTARAPTA
jgi:hypothetical protein